MLKRKTLKKHYLILLLLSLCFCPFSQSVLAQRDIKQLENAEVVVNEKCGFSAEVVKSFSMTEKVARIFLLMDGKYFTQPYLKRFFTCVSREYAKLAALDIAILSDREELEIEIERFLNPPPIENSSENVTFKSQSTSRPYYYRAYYHRSTREYFEYSPNLRSWRMVTYNFKKTSVPLVK